MNIKEVMNSYLREVPANGNSSTGNETTCPDMETMKKGALQAIATTLFGEQGPDAECIDRGQRPPCYYFYPQPQVVDCNGKVETG